jgi:nitrate/TMAO reductase-like tetraheme cytochrome c subunit
MSASERGKESEAAKPKRRRLTRIIRHLAVIGLVLLFVGAAGIAGAEYYTSRPTFCGSCHIMDPYYESWSKDLHGTKLHVLCVDCHYAPGERRTIAAKFKGLSQATSYFSGRYGSGRPRAHVSDDSCLQSGCHGDLEFISKSIMIGEERIEQRDVAGSNVEVRRLPTVRFSHENHLNVDAAMAEARQAIEDLSSKLRNELSGERFSDLQDVAVSVLNAAKRRSSTTELIEAWAPSNRLRADAHEWVRLEHRVTRLAQLENLSCTACHRFDASGEHHIKVDQQSCFTCHFAGEAFNENTGACLNCHEAPVRKILVHDVLGAGGEDPVFMDHRLMLERNVNCESCHFDVVRGGGAVSERSCRQCHDQDRYVADFASRTTEQVRDYHDVHISSQRAACEDCHVEIEHSLVRPEDTADGAAFLKPILDDCQHCHPNHHTEQIAILTGTGGVGADRAMPNAMFGSRINCRACHSEMGEDFKGDPLVRATQQACLQCHEDEYAEKFDQWRHEIDARLTEAREKLEQAKSAVDRRRDAGASPSDEINFLLDQAAKNIRLVRAADGIHNRNYSLHLLEISIVGLDRVLNLMGDQSP